jgi:UDP-2,3-diacylglucosamine pyrophosphatase LpxH
VPGTGDVPDLVTIDVPRGTRVLVVSDLHLRPEKSDASRWSTTELSRLLRDWRGPGIVVLVGDILECWFIIPADPKGSLAAHPELTRALGEFAAGEGRRVVYLVGNHDGRVAWDPETLDLIRRELHAQDVALTGELRLEGSSDGRRVRIEHGHAYDPSNRFYDPRDPHDSPVGQHIVQEVLHEIEPMERRTWLDGIETLSNPRTVPAFIASRIFYRRVARRTWWFIVPLFLVLLAHIPLTVWLLEPGSRLRSLVHWVFLLDILIVVVLAVVAGGVLWGVRRSWKDANSVIGEKRGKEQNDNTRAAGARLIASGYAGMVAAHTHHPELSPLDGGFYANTGSGTRVLDRAEARFGLPHVFLPRIQLSWVELEGKDDWRVRLYAGRKETPGATTLERRIAKKQELRPRRLGQAGSYP